MLINKIKKNNIQNKGLTLIEILITMAIFTFIMGAVSLFARDIFQYEDIFSGGLTAYDEARKVLQPIASEVRSASPSSLGSYPIEVAGDTNFIFYSDINNDGLKERIRYFLSEGALVRGVIIPSGNPLQYSSSNEIISEIVHGIINNSTAIFTYYDSNYDGNTSPLTQPVPVLNVRLIKITLILDIDPNRQPLPVTVTTQISIRNLKDNL
jgi:prepilin-type N-terminal cleavage/methylation domain-containing protein